LPLASWGLTAAAQAAALIADGAHARADAYVSLAVVASAAALAVGVDVADALIGLAISLVILRITWASWRTVSVTTRTDQPVRAASTASRKAPLPNEPSRRAATRPSAPMVKSQGSV
jgi:Co/Zn/Cd efflux system component